jgi:hypothetical protein
MLRTERDQRTSRAAEQAVEDYVLWLRGRMKCHDHSEAQMSREYAAMCRKGPGSELVFGLILGEWADSDPKYRRGRKGVFAYVLDDPVEPEWVLEHQLRTDEVVASSDVTARRAR